MSHGTSDGPEGIVAANATKPDLIILDVVLPKLDGFLVCQELRRITDTRFVPIILVTGLDDTDSIERGFEVGATDFIVKPIDWPLFALRIRHVLRNYHIWKHSSQQT